MEKYIESTSRIHREGTKMEKKITKQNKAVGRREGERMHNLKC